MYHVIEEALSALAFGTAQTCGRAAVLPIMGEAPAPGPVYLMLSEALQQELLRVSEVSEGGSVPELKVVNEASLPVLILDGEELRGAKQNRVVNTTILLKEKSETVIPVSCTERGRWRYQTRNFADSEAVMARAARGKKSRSVFASLKMSGVHRSNQAEVWEEVHRLHEELHVASPTAAMRDAFESRRNTLDEWFNNFPVQDGQTGLVFLLDGKVLGLEFLSRPEAYRRVHERLIKSYTIDLDPAEPTKETAEPVEVSRAFAAVLRTLTEDVYPSCGYGMDYRCENPAVCGSVLVHEETCIHAAFFQDNAQEHRQPGLASFYERTYHRRQYPEG